MKAARLKQDSLATIASNFGAETPKTYAQDTWERYQAWKIPLNPTQEAARSNKKARFILLDGERASGKTQGALYIAVEHCYLEVNAHVTIITQVANMAEEGGAWHKLNFEVLPEWKESIGLEYSEPGNAIGSRKPFVMVRNRYGSGSRIVCWSMPVEAHAPERAKGWESSLIIVDEAQVFTSNKLFSSLVQQLGRRPRIKGIQRIIFCANPAGTSHPLYKRFFEMPIDAETGEWDDAYARYHVPIQENLHNLPAGYYDNVLEAVRGDPIEEARMVRGEWVDRPTGRGLFTSYFSRELHVRGDFKQGIGIRPTPNIPVRVGYDLGPANSSVHFLQRIVTKEKPLWIVFDELNFVGTYTPYAMLVPRIIARMRYWEDLVGKLTWDHISDANAFSFMRPDGSFDALDVERLSAGAIRMRSAPKHSGSVRERIRLVTDKLMMGELMVSAICTKTIAMFEGLQDATKGEESWEPEAGLKPRKSPHVHSFDSLSYVLMAIEDTPGSYALQQTDGGSRITYFGGQHRAGFGKHH